MYGTASMDSDNLKAQIAVKNIPRATETQRRDAVIALVNTGVILSWSKEELRAGLEALGLNRDDMAAAKDHLAFQRESRRG